MTGNKNTTKYQGRNQTKDIDLAQEKEKEHNMIQETKLQIMELGDIAWCAKNKDITHYFTAQSYQNTFPEVTTSNLLPEDYVKFAYQLLSTPRIAPITTQRTTIIGYARRAELTSYSARIVINI